MFTDIEIAQQAEMLPIKEIARRMGFKTTGGFTASFKQVEGMTPRQYRRSKLA